MAKNLISKVPFKTSDVKTSYRKRVFNNLIDDEIDVEMNTVKKRLLSNFKLRIPLGTFTYCPQVLVKVMNSQSLCLMLMIRNFY